MKSISGSEDRSGFTLLEVIITLTVGAILLAVIVPYLGTLVTRSGTPLAHLKNTLTVYQVMENMTADYRFQQAAGTLDLPAFQNKIGSVEGSDQSNGFGTYHVVTNRFILFDGAGQEIAAGGSQNILKVTIRPQGTGGATFTTLFTGDLP